MLAAMIAFVLYLPTVNYEYALDDGMYIMQNSLTQGGIANIKAIFTTGSIHDFNPDNGPEPWRPLTILSFAIGKSGWNNAPGIEHFINISLYACTAWLLFSLLASMGLGASHVVLLLCVLLFVTHPVHTEVVANIKSRDEMLCLLFALAAWRCWQPHLHNYKRQAFAALFFMAALLSKETAIVFTLIIPLSAWIISDTPRKQILLATLPIWGVAIVYLLLRQAVVGTVLEAAEGDPVNNILYAAQTTDTYIATVLYLLGFYFLKLFIPIDLLHDYALYHIDVTDMGDVQVWMVVVLLGVCAYSIWHYWKRIPIAALGIILFLAALSPTANIFFLNGASFGERFLYMPTLGACVFLPLAWLKGHGKNTKWMLPFFSALTILWAAATIVRIPDWRNNQTLFESGIAVAPDNARIHASLAFDYKERAFKSRKTAEQQSYLQKAEREFLASMRLYPDFHYTTYNLGVMYYETGRKEKAKKVYQEGVRRFPNHRDMHNNLGVLYFEERNFEDAAEMFSKALAIDSNDANGRANLGACYQNTGDPVAAEEQYLKALKVNPQHQGAIGNLILIYQNRGDTEKTMYYEALRQKK
jgi:tetratricopeptide (TPR) repeat protein